MTRIVDVARHAGVSTATVSRVLNGKQVRADLADAVRRAVDELGYSPDRTARSLRRRHSEVIALILPDIENPFFTALARGVEDVAIEAGYSVVLCNTDDVPDKERRYLAVAESENMAGVIIAPASNTPDLDGLLARGRAVVVIDRVVDNNVDQVVFDNVALGRIATQALVARDFRRIACVTGPAATSTAAERAIGWRDTLLEAGLPADDELLIHANFRVDGGRTAARRLVALEAPPDAILATNNLVGVGVLQALAEMAVPHGDRDSSGTDPSHRPAIGVIGDLPFMTSRSDDIVLIPLTPKAMGLAAARMLLERIDGLDTPPRRMVQENGMPIGKPADVPPVPSPQQ